MARDREQGHNTQGGFAMTGLKFDRLDAHFQDNLRALRQAVISRRACVPTRLDIVIDGKAVTASTAHIRPDGWFAYTDGIGERRVELERVGSVEAFFA